MDDNDLLTETNELIKRWLELDREEKAAIQLACDEYEAKSKLAKEDLDKTWNEKVAERGLPPSAAKISASELEKRQRDAIEMSRLRVSEATRVHNQFRLELLDELQVQSQLLNQIWEVLGGKP